MIKFLPALSKRSFFLFFLFLFSIVQINAQTTVVINTGTAGTPQYNAGPIYRSATGSAYDASRYAYLYTQSELAAAGIFPGSIISQVGWTKANSATTTGGGIFRIFMKNTTASAFSSASESWANLNSGATKVYENTNQTIPATVAPNYITFDLNTNFVYTGGSLEIATEWDITGVSGNPTTGTFDWLWSNVTDRIYGIGQQTLATAGTLSSTSNSISDIDNRRPFIQIAYTPGTSCSGTPTAGSAEASSAFVCTGENFSLSLDGETVAAGITYQWQSSTDNTNWTNISGGTTSTYTTSQTSNTYYRAVVSCGSNSSTSTSVQVVTPPLVSGTFTINSAQPTGGSNFQSFNDAYNYIKCGINGPVVFNVVNGSGPYNEQLIMTEIIGASATNTVTFNGNGAILTYNSTNSGERAVIKLDGADHITFDNLIISAPGTTTSEYGYGVQLLNDADSNTISNSFVNLNLTSTSTNYAGIVVSSSATSAVTNGTTLSDGNTFLNNTITGGYYGITLVGSTTAADFISGNKIVGNTIQDFYTYGILVDGTDKTLIELNNIKRTVRTDGGASIYGIYFTGASSNANVSKNRMHNMFDSYATTTDNFYGIYFTSADATAGNENVVSNNLIYDIKSNGLIYAIYNVGSNYANYYHNTISLDDAASTSTEATKGFYQTTLASGIEFKNNIVTITRGGTGEKHAIHMNTTTTTYESNYNDFYITAGTDHYVGAIGTADHATLADWQTASGKDANSVSIDPVYQNMAGENYSPTNATLNDLGTPVGITTDIENEARSTTTPDIGAYEFTVGPCTTPPTAGTVVLSETGAVCPFTTISFNLTGNSIGIGQTYQWESSPSTAGPWTPISGSLTSPPFDHTVGTATLYYRAAVTCSGSTTHTLPVQIVVNPLFPGGTYTINSAVVTGGTNFQSFNDAYDAMRCGIDGAVVFNVVAGSGPYNEQLIMESIQGTSSTNTITFNGNGQTITFKSTDGSERAVIKLNGTDYVTFDNLNIVAQGTGTSEYGFGVQLMNDADFNTISNSTIVVDSTTSSTNYAGLVVSNSPTSATATGETQSDNNTFSNNIITGGYYGITLVGSSTLANQNTRIINNLVQEFYQYGIYVNGSFETLIEANTITRPSRTTVTTFSGIYFTGLSTSANITRNIITNPFGGNLTSTSLFNGIYFSGVDGFAGLENVVSNNLIYGLNGNGDINAIYNSSSDNVWYYHNTISLDKTSTVTTSSDFTRGFYQTTTAGGIEFKNNIIVISEQSASTKTALYFNTDASQIISNYNNLYISSVSGVNNIGFAGGNEYNILLNWQTGTSQDLNSVSNDPIFENPAAGNFKPTNAVMDNLGVPVGVLVDILNATRSITTPDLGAYEFAPPPCITPPNAGTAVVSETPVCENSFVQLGATGYSTGLGQTYRWQAATDIGGTYANISGILSNPSFTITATSTFYYRLAVTCVGNTQFSTPVLLEVTPGLPGGIYTIDPAQPASSTNFLSFNEAKDAMACGITGPVVFNVEPNSGPYLEQLILDSIPGTSATNTITFNGNGNTIQFSSSTSAERAVIKLNGTDHVTFDSLIIDATGTGTYGWGVQLTNDADSNTFRRNTIITDITSTSTVNYGGVVISASATSMTSGSSLSDGNEFDRNRITGGYYGVTVMGSSSAPIHNNVFTNNIIEDFRSYGIYVSQTNNTLIEGNTITRPTRTSVTTFNGIYFTSLSTNARVAKNIITSPFGGDNSSTSAAYGIYFTGVDAPTGQENKVINNLLYDFNGSGTIYGFYNSSSDNVYYYHNIISLDNTANTTSSITRGFYQVTTAEGIEFKNNIITISRGGTGEKHAIYMGATGTTFSSDYNNFYITPAANHYIGSLGTADHATLASWQAVTSGDANSVSIDPLYTNPASGNFMPMQALIDNMGTPLGVMTDILNAPRSATTPDIGAYEFSITPCTAPPTAGTSVANPSSGICLGTIIELSLTGNSTGGFQNYIWQRSSSATGTWTDISDTLYSPELNYELQTTDTYFRAAVTCGGSTVYSTPVQVNINPALIAGDYTIDPSIPTAGSNYQTFAEVVQALECGIAGSVRFHAVPGTYNEQIRIRKVPGASATSTVTFMSQTGVASSVILTYDASTSTNNYVLKLDSASYITFKNISITAISGTAVEFAGTASHDSLLKNIITVPVSTTTTTNVVGVYGTSLRGINNVIKENTINGGSSSIYLSGVTGVATGFVIDSNIVNDSYYYGIYTGNIQRININGNKVTRTGLLNTTSYGIYTTNNDSAYQITNNLVDIHNTGTTVYGIYLTGNQASNIERGRVANNKITAVTANTGNLYGLYVTTSTFNHSVNNVISINTTGSTSYGIYSSGTGGIKYYNNSVQSAATSTTTNVAGYFSQTSGNNGAVEIRNNILSHIGGGTAMYIVNPRFIYSDYNMLYTTGNTLIRWGTANAYATLQEWRDTSYWDFNSIVYEPAFSSNTDLTPDLASPHVWAIHGRGEQIEGNDRDFNNNDRPTTLTAGVPDLGAYEFVPTSVPVLLTATPSTPVPNSTQVFMLGTDTVSKITWGATVPTTIEGKRYSGVVPPGLAAGQKHMYFYTDFDITGTMPADYSIHQFYIDPWLGFIDDERAIKLGRTDAANVWQVATNSTVQIMDNYISEENLSFIDKFTGLTDGNFTLPPIVINPSDSANRGKEFWVGYGHHQDFGGGNAQEMVLYLGAGSTPANVTVRVNGTNWVKTYTIPANTVISSDFMPKYGVFDARLTEEGLSEKGISIMSDVPITAYAHIYGNTNSGATMLMPIGTYGTEYVALTAKQNYAANTYSWFYVVAPYDSTVVVITPSKPTLNGRPAGVPFTVTLKKGEVYQVLGAIISGSDGYDMTGSIVKSIANANGKCYPVAMFSGSSRTNIGCGNTTPSASGDNIIQQNFPYRAWGRKYLTAPTSSSTSAATPHNNIYKVAVKDPATVVTRNGVALTNLIDNLYYQFESNTADYIVADKPIMMAQFIPSQGGNAACGNSGVLDPEMIYISPMEQGIRSVALYRNTEYNITTQYLTLIIPTGGVSSLLIDGSNVFDHTYAHQNLPGYSVVVKRWAASRGQTFVQSDSAFTAITYGLGSAESYGYNAGTLVKNLNIFPSFVNVLNTSSTTSDYTCAGTPFKASFLSTVQPQIIEWNFGGINNLSPNNNVVQNNPTPDSSVVINDITYYRYSVNQPLVFSSTGTYFVPIFITHPDVEGCNNRMETSLEIKVIPSPVVDFDNSITYCYGTNVQFNGTSTSSNNTPVTTWNWNFDDNNATANIQNPTHIFSTPGTYDVELSIVGEDGCIADTVKSIQITDGPGVTFVPDSIGACIGDNVTFTVQNPVTGAIYRWYDAPTGGNLIHTGNDYTINNVTGASTLYVESDLNGCIGVARTTVKVTVLPALATPVVVVDSVSTNTVRFRWNAIQGATGYEVSIDGGTTWTVPSSGSTGTTHTVSGLQVGQSITLVVRVLGGCEPISSLPVTAITVTDQVFIPNSFTPNGDGMNDVLQVYGNTIRSIRFMVFNQWGEKITESNTPSRVWDGTYKGQIQPSGVYMYVCTITLTDGSTLQRKGSINLIK